MAEDIIPATPRNLVVGDRHLPAVAPELEDSPQSAIKIGLAIAFFFFVILLGWAAFARLDAAAYGEGQVSVNGNRQTIQHREGGIIQQLRVREGQHVKAGDILITLQGADVEASERALAGSVIDLLAQRARLEAEIRNAPLKAPAEFASFNGQNRILAERAINLQARVLAARSSAIANSRSALRQQEAGIASTSSGYAAQANANERQRKSLEAQLESTRKLAEEGFASTNTIRTLERQIQGLQGTTADYASRVYAARAQIGQTREESIGVSRKYIEDSAQSLTSTQFQINEAMPKWISAKQELERTVIRATVAGKVVGLRYFTIGGVINPGTPILDIVPDAAPLIIKANFAPTDIDGVNEGKMAEVKFLSMHERDLPILIGKIRNVSADTLKDETSGRSYFTAEVAVTEDQMRLLRNVRKDDLGVRPGVPVSIVVKLRKRTALQYLISPLTDAFSRSFHER